MSAAPPPSAIFLAIHGLRGAADQAAVEAALRRCDPQARVWTDWPQGLVAVESRAPAEALRIAVQDAGFIAGVTSAASALAPRRQGGAAAVRTIGFGLAGFVLGGLIGAAAGFLNLIVSPVCQSTGNSGGCAMGIPLMAIAAGLLGGPIGVGLAFIRGR